MKVQTDNRIDLRLNCLSKSLAEISQQISIRLNIKENTFFLFYDNQPIFKMDDSYNDKTVKLIEHSPIKFLHTDDPNDIYNKLRFTPTYTDIRRLKLLSNASTAFVIEKMLIRHIEKLITCLGWNYLLNLITFRPQIARLLCHTVQRRLNLISNIDVAWMMKFSFHYAILIFTQDTQFNATEVNTCNYLFELLELFINRGFIESTEICVFVSEMELVLQKYIKKLAIEPCDYIASFYNNKIYKRIIKFEQIKNFTKMTNILNKVYKNYFSISVYKDISTLIVSFLRTIPIINNGLNISIFNECEPQFLRSNLFIVWIELIEMIHQFKTNFYQNRFEYEFYKLVPFIIERGLLELGTTYFENYKFIREDKLILTIPSKMLLLSSDITKLTFDRTTVMEVERNNIIEESYHIIDYNNYLQQLDITFKNEMGYGEGVVREYLSLLIKEIVNPDVGLFQIHKSGLYYPVPHIFQDIENEYYYRLLGLAIMYSIIYRIAIPIAFPKLFYSFLISDNINLALMSDLQELQPDLYKSYNSLKNLTVSEFNYLDLEWEVNITSGPFSEKYFIINPVNPNIRTVKYENLDVYINSCIKELLISQVEFEMKSIKNTFSKIFKHLNILNCFTGRELKQLVEGEQIIDIDLWKSKTNSVGFEEESLTLKWFWEILADFDPQEKKLLYKFATGMQAMPLHNITYKLTGINTYQLPTSNTCFYQMNIFSNYSEKTKLRQDLLISINNQDFLNE